MPERYIFKREYESKFTTVPNDLIQNGDLTWEARGMLVYLLSKPKDWVVMKKDLEKQSPASDYVVSRILKELEDFRYIRREKTKNEKGQWEWHTWVYDEPIPQELGDGQETIPQKLGDGLEEKTIPQLSIDGLPTDGKLGYIQKTELLKTEKQKKEKENYDKNGGCRNIFQLYSEEISELTPGIKDRLILAEKEYPGPWIEKAFMIAIENNVRKWSYISAILKNWNKAGGPEEYEKQDKPHQDYVEGEFAEFIE